MTPEHIKSQIIELGASLFQRGFSVGSAGNISVAMDTGFLMTPTNSSLGRLRADDLSVMDAGWRHVGGMRPSKEVVLHQAVYGARPGAAAVVHLHSPAVTAISCLSHPTEAVIPPLTPYLTMRAGRDIPVVPYFRPGSSEVAASIMLAAERSPAIILGNHGSIVAGATLEDAVNAAEELEASAALALALHGRRTRLLTSDELDELDAMRIGRH